MRVLYFLLDTVFFVLVGAALLRAWMNGRRMRMTQQPGVFVIAISDWLVKPLRRILPRSWAQANTDWGSLSAACVLAFLYAGLWHLSLLLLDSVEFESWALSLLLMAVLFLIRTVLQGLTVLVIVYAISTWIQPASPVLGPLSRLVDPLLAPIRKVIPAIGGVDLSALVLILALQIGLLIIG